MQLIRQNIENLRYAIKWHSFDITRDQQDSLLILLDKLESQLNAYQALNKKGI